MYFIFFPIGYIAVGSFLYIVALVYRDGCRVIFKYIELFKQLLSKASLVNIDSTVRAVTNDLHT